MQIMSTVRQRALFLDRDGVINVNHGYVHSIENFDFVDGIFDLVSAACAAGYRVVVVTNQAGIARGFYSEKQFDELTTWMCSQFESRGATIDKVYFSPFHPTSGIGEYMRDEDTRKPGPGMITRAKLELGLSLDDSILVGDKPTDILAGLAAGVKTNILFSNDVFPELSGIDHLTVPSLKDVIACLEGAIPTVAL